MESVYSIADIARETGLTYDTIRYYEKIGLVPPPDRTENGQRQYGKLDLERFLFIVRLRQTRMPIKSIERYMQLAMDQQYESCYNVLLEHKQQIDQQLTEIQSTLEVMNFKLEHYQDMMRLSNIGGKNFMNNFSYYTATPQAPLPSGFGVTTTAEEALGGRDLTGKIAIVTGGYSGIGLETTRVLSEAGATVIVPARTLGKAREALASIPRIELEELDLIDPASIDAFAQRFLDSGRPLDILINNAGIMGPKVTHDARGYEAQFATNHLGHFQLTARLWPALKQSGNARVVSLSSIGIHIAGIDFDDVNFKDRAYDKYLAYGQSKTANSLFAVGLDRRGQPHGIRAFAVHPGSIETDLARDVSEEELTATSSQYTFITTEQGAATSVWCATNLQLEGKGGVYCESVDISALVPDDAPFGPGVLQRAIDPGLAERLWLLSQEMTGVTFSG
jgi:NAD(P)-dependent dehydrogenase (short-subunit alcohol dehydrogenase family)/DNA-binding transcriptional MerR regulator